MSANDRIAHNQSIFSIPTQPRLMAERYHVLKVGLSIVGMTWYSSIWTVGLLGSWTA
jgi:hypothetical protein